MSSLEMKICPDTAMLPPVLAAIRAYAEPYFKADKDVNRIVLAVEEAVGNVLRFSLTGHLKDITVTAESADGEFTVYVLDQGLPGNYEETLKGDDRLGLTLMHNAMDVVSVENLGYGGRRQKLVKYYSIMPDLTAPEQSDSDAPIENAEISVRSPKKDEMLEICRAFYKEYGLTYPNEIIYYPDRFYAAVAKDQIHSTVAVDQFGNLAGHHGVFQWDNLPGIWESGMAIVNNRYRNAGIFKKMMARTYSYVHDEAKAKMFMGCCVTTHPYSQKLRLKYGSFPCGFAFNLAPPDTCQSSFKESAEFTTDTYAATCFDFTPKTVYLPAELVPAVEYIYKGLGLPRTICTDDLEPEIDVTESSWEYSNYLRNGTSVFKRIGRDCSSRIAQDAYELRNRGAEMIMLDINIDHPGFTAMYDAAKAEGFFFTGLLPNADMGDVAIMQKLLSNVINYDSIITVEPYTGLLNMVRSLDPDQQK